MAPAAWTEEKPRMGRVSPRDLESEIRVAPSRPGVRGRRASVPLLEAHCV